MVRQVGEDTADHKRTRVVWIDIAKAYGIIAIVLGHIIINGPVAHFLYWWHIPIFFIISGIFLKPLRSRQAWIQFLKKRVVFELYRVCSSWYTAHLALYSDSS